MAAAFFKEFVDPAEAEAVSAGTEPGLRVHPEVLAAMQEVGIDLSAAMPKKLTQELANDATLLITMGCGDKCPYVPGLRRNDWRHATQRVFLAAHPGLVQIENGWRNPKEQRPGAVQRGHVREIEAVTENPHAEPVTPCESAKAAIVVYGKQLGRKLTVCTDKHCPVHDPQAAAEAAANPVPAMAPVPEAETEEEAAERQAEFERQRAEYEEERQRREEERKQQFEREQAEIEAEHNRRAEIIKARQATFERIIENAPATLSAAQLRVLLRAFVNLDPYTFADDLAEDIAADNANEQRSAEEILLSTIDTTADDKLTHFALRLALGGHVGIPRERFSPPWLCAWQPLTSTAR